MKNDHNRTSSVISRVDGNYYDVSLGEDEVQCNAYLVVFDLFLPKTEEN